MWNIYRLRLRYKVSAVGLLYYSYSVQYEVVTVYIPRNGKGQHKVA